MFIIWLWLKEAFVGLFRNLWWSMMAIFLSISCFLFFSISYIASLNAEHFAGLLTEKVEIKMILLDNVKDQKDIEKRLLQLKQVKDVTYVSKNDAFSEMKQDMGENSEVLDVLDRNPFPASFIVKLKNPEQVQEVANIIETWKVTESIHYGEEYVENLLQASRFVKNIAIVVTIFAALFAVSTVIITIRSNIMQRKNEIRVKQLVGAGNFTIRFPFVLEALFLTVGSSVIVYYLFAYGYEKMVYFIQGAIPYAPFLAANEVLHTMLFPLLGIAVAIGIIGSMFSTKRFLKKF